MEIKSGKDTSEFKLTQLVVVANAILVALGSVLEVLAQNGMGEKWVGIALILIGVLGKLAATFGYTKERQTLKLAAQDVEAEKARAVADEKVKNLQEAQDVIEDTFLKGLK